MKLFTYFSFFLQMPAPLTLLALLLGLAHSPHAQTFLGLTSRGGVDNIGTIVEYDNATTHLSVVASFPITASGKNPVHTDLIEFEGKFYGMTSSGGTSNNGVVFEWDPGTNTLTKKVDFDGTARGSNPYGSLTLFGSKFYGMTQYGGTNNHGVIFEWDPAANTFTKKVDFDSTARGSNPYGSLTLFGGKFYGMTQYGGTNNHGVIFEWDPGANTFTKKVDFDGTSKGSNPLGSLTLSGGKFYGLTAGGGASNHGVIFEWDPDTNTFTKKVDLISFNGLYPIGSLTLFGGKFYGMTQFGGASYNGVIFEWDPATNIFAKKVDFDGKAKGKHPQGSLTLSGGKFYGMTTEGGTNNTGVIFEWDPGTNAYSQKGDFVDGSQGSYPQGSLTLSGGKFYGMTSAGGTAGGGVIFEWDPGTNTFTPKIDFDGMARGGYPSSSLVLYRGKFYGMAYDGGTSNNGVLFEWAPDTHILTPKVNLDFLKGSYPLGSLTLFGDKFYGMTQLGGTSNAGVIFEWDPSTNVFTKKVDFNRMDKGGYPEGSLTLSGGKFYGTAPYGGTSGYGILFEWDPGTNTYTEKVAFDGTAKGGWPSGSLTLFDGKFYGMTQFGGTNNAGVLFEWDPVTNVFTKKVDFNSMANGRNLRGSLTLSGDKFYGMACEGGASNAGVLFEWDPVANVFTKKVDFGGIAKGSNPWGSLTLFGGKFYGMTKLGGTSDMGVLFEWDPATNVFTKKADFDGSNGAIPMGDLTVIPGTTHTIDPRSASATGLMAWPNPTPAQVAVRIPKGVFTLTLTDEAGRVIRTVPTTGQATTISLDLSGLASGGYILRAGAAAVRVVKE